jgi:leukotriene-A4 hydrolase
MHSVSFFDFLCLSVVFLERLQSLKSFPSSHVHHLTAVYSFNKSTNCDIRLRWYSLALSSAAGSDFASDAAAWLVDKETGLKGRMKFCRPIFKAISKVDPKLAKETFTAHASEFHPIARRLIELVSTRLAYAQVIAFS